MASINPINVNTSGIGANYIYGNNAGAKKKEDVTEEKQQTQANAKNVAPDSVFDYMAANANTLVASAAAKSGVTAIDTSKYVDAASKARIEASIGAFQNQVNDGINAFNQEFPNSAMSDSAKMTVVLKQINNNI